MANHYSSNDILQVSLKIKCFTTKERVHWVWVQQAAWCWCLSRPCGSVSPCLCMHSTHGHIAFAPRSQPTPPRMMQSNRLRPHIMELWFCPPPAHPRNSTWWANSQQGWFGLVSLEQVHGYQKHKYLIEKYKKTFLNQILCILDHMCTAAYIHSQMKSITIPIHLAILYVVLWEISNSFFTTRWWGHSVGSSLASQTTVGLIHNCVWGTGILQVFLHVFVT